MTLLCPSCFNEINGSDLCKLATEKKQNRLYTHMAVQKWTYDVHVKNKSCVHVFLKWNQIISYFQTGIQNIKHVIIVWKMHAPVFHCGEKKKKERPTRDYVNAKSKNSCLIEGGERRKTAKIYIYPGRYISQRLWNKAGTPTSHKYYLLSQRCSRLPGRHDQRTRIVSSHSSESSILVLLLWSINDYLAWLMTVLYNNINNKISIFIIILAIVIIIKYFWLIL